MPMQLSIRDIRALRIDYSTVPTDTSSGEAAEGPEETKKEVNFTLNFKAQYLQVEDQPTLKVILGVQVKGNDLPFALIAEMGGIFSIEGEMPPDDEFDKIKHINCNAILFPYLRELVSEICRRGGNPALYLPPVNFVQLYKEGVFKQEPSQQ